MFDRDSPTRHTAFTETEFTALQALRARHHATSRLFTQRELAHLRFLHWLVHQRASRHAPDKPRRADTVQVNPATEPAKDERIYRLKAAHDAGYYRTEAAEGDQTQFPWQNKTCKDCPFWSSSICEVFEEYRSSTASTCGYSDPWNHSVGQRFVQDHRWRGFRRWWEWFSDRRATQ